MPKNRKNSTFYHLSGLYLENQGGLGVKFFLESFRVIPTYMGHMSFSRAISVFWVFFKMFALIYNDPYIKGVFGEAGKNFA